MNLVYTNREERAKYTVLKYQKYLKGKVLDVGCWNKHLEKYLSRDVEYTGIDVGGNPDIFVDLEKRKIPFQNNEFYCVVCTDVLEHLNNIHQVFDELIRVSRRYVIVSLPNNWCVIKKNILKGRGSLKFYGLPVEVPRDRHRWFFNYEEAEKFIYGRAERNKAKVLICESYAAKRDRLKRLFTGLLWGSGERYKNLFAEAIWAVLEKNRNKGS